MPCQGDNVVISGMSAVFPKSDNVEEFAENLFAKENLLSDVPNMPVKLGKLNDLSKFDAEFFGFHLPHRVKVMEPMSRIILEKSYEALVDSGTNPHLLKGQNCGVYVAVHLVDTEMLTYQKIEKGAFLAQSRSFLANRISHWLGIHGPSYSVDAACSSTLVALEVAFKAIRRGDCDSAIVGGCHISLHPATLLHLLEVGALNPKSESRVFDENAGGFCKGECVGVFYLERESKAKRAYARIVNAGVGHDGSKPSFLSPWGPSQADLLRRVYRESRIDCDSVAWIEAHATGTQVGDKQEVNAIASVFADRRSPLLIGSVKSNMGHAEAAAGVSSLSKVIIAMETGFIPPNINITNLRKDIEAFQNGRIKVVTEKTPWNGGIVGVSGFGMGGVNCHVVLESFPKEKIDRGIPSDQLPRIVAVSGRTQQAVHVLLTYLEETRLDCELVGLLHEIHKENIRSHSYRGVILLRKNERPMFKEIRRTTDGAARQTLFVFTNSVGQLGRIYRGLGEIAVFQRSIRSSHSILSKFGLDLTHILDNNYRQQNSSLFDSYISSVAVQIALYQVMRALQLLPDRIIGCSSGALVCAYVDGSLNSEQTLSAAFYCAAFLAARHDVAGAATVHADIAHSALASTVLPSPFRLTFPAVVTGPDDDGQLSRFFNSRQIPIRRMRCGGSCYTPAITDLDQLKDLLRQIAPHPQTRSEKWIEWPEPEAAGCLDSLDSLDYLVECAIAPVAASPDWARVADALVVSFLPTLGHATQPPISNVSVSLTTTAADHDEPAANVMAAFLRAIGELYLSGRKAHLAPLYPPVSYPVSRATKMIAPLVRWNHTASWPVAFASPHECLVSGHRLVAVSLDDARYSFLAGHQIDSTLVFPATGYLVLVWETLALTLGKMHVDLPVEFENVRFLETVQMCSKETVLLEVAVHKATGIFEVSEKGRCVATGRVGALSARPKWSSLASAGAGAGAKRAAATHPSVLLDGADFYRYVLTRGCNYKGSFRAIVQINGHGTEARVSWTRNWIAYLDALLQMSILRDTRDAVRVPVRIEKLVVDTQRHHQFTASSATELDAFYDEATDTIASAGVRIKGIALRPVSPESLRNNPLLRKLRFAPFDSRLQADLSAEEVIRQFCHVIMDNVGQRTPRVKIAEIAEQNFDATNPLLAPFISNFAKEQPLFKPLVTVYFGTKADRPVPSTDHLQFATVDGSLPANEFAYAIVCSDMLSHEQKLKVASESLYDDGFLICVEKADAAVGRRGYEYECDIGLPSNLILCCHALCDSTRYVLLRKKSNRRNANYRLIEVRCDEFAWIEELQEALALKTNTPDRIVLYADRDPYNGILGFFRSLRLERNTDHLRCFLILDEGKKFSAADPCLAQQLEKDLAINVLEDGEWGCYVRQVAHPLSAVDVRHAFVRLDNAHERSMVRWEASQPPSASFEGGPAEVDDGLFHVYYAAVNSTDVSLFGRRTPVETVVPDPFEKDHVLGVEFSGRSSSGQRFMGLATHGCLRSHIQLEAERVLYNRIPDGWSLEDAATVPLAYYTVIYGLVFCARLKEDEFVLIHSAGNPFGQAALNLATHFKCTILASVLSADEAHFVRENLPSLSKANTVDLGGDADADADEDSLSRFVYERTAGAGVDVVLDYSLVESLATNARCLAKNGRYVRLKRADPRNTRFNANTLLLDKNISLQSALLEDIFNLEPAKRALLEETVDSYVRKGAVQPLRRSVYSYAHVQLAFESASSPSNFCKCVIRVRAEEDDELDARPAEKFVKAHPRFLCHPEKIYIVCGGLGGMGMELINWLIIRGARKVVISSRKAEAVGSQIVRINRWMSYGVNVVLVKADISDLAQTSSLLDTANTLGIVDAIFNLAAVTNSKMFKNQSVKNFVSTAAPKFRGTANLDKASRAQCAHLKHFVVFSSVASAFGSLGQTEYALFNSAAERVCQQRRRHNLPALAVQWGAVGNVGMLVSHLDGDTNDSFGGFLMQPIKSCLEALDQFLCQTADTIVSSCIVSN